MHGQCDISELCGIERHSIKLYRFSEVCGPVGNIQHMYRKFQFIELFCTKRDGINMHRFSEICRIIRYGKHLHGKYEHSELRRTCRDSVSVQRASEVCGPVRDINSMFRDLFIRKICVGQRDSD
jgi:hypothetical protein